MNLWEKIKEIVRKMLPKKSIESVLHITPAISDRMVEAIQLWSDMYEGHAPWLRFPTVDDPVRVTSLGLPALIASEKARMVCLEMKSEINAPMKDVPVTEEDKSVSAVASPAISETSPYRTTTKQVPNGPTERADFLNSQYKKLLRQIRRQLEYGIAKGGLVIKPYVVRYKKKDSTSSQNQTKDVGPNNDTVKETNRNTSEPGVLHYDSNLDEFEIEFDYVQADRFFPLTFDSNGKVIEAAFIQTKVDKAKEKVYSRLEYHKLEKRKVTVQNYAFESNNLTLANTNNIRMATDLGNPVPLSTVPEWASLAPSVVIEDVDRLLFAYFRMPDANTIDPYSPLGVSGYSRVIQLIEDADRQYSRMLWEFEGGELAVDVDRDAMKFITDPSSKDHSVLPMSQQRLFRKIDLNTEDTYNVFSPALRDSSIINGLNTILMRIEDACGLSRGTLSEITSQQAKTATELKILKQRSYATNADIQQALQDALTDVIYVMDVYCTLYEVTPAGDYETSFEWDDSIIIDSESELSKRITLMQNGLASKLETRMWYFGETENQAKLALQQIDAEAQEAARQKAEADATVAEALNKVNGGGNEPNTTSPSDTTGKKISTGQQADNLENPNKSKTVDQIKTTE